MRVALLGFRQRALAGVGVGWLLGGVDVGDAQVAGLAGLGVAHFPVAQHASTGCADRRAGVAGVGSSSRARSARHAATSARNHWPKPGVGAERHDEPQVGGIGRTASREPNPESTTQTTGRSQLADALKRRRRHTASLGPDAAGRDRDPGAGGGLQGPDLARDVAVAPSPWRSAPSPHTRRRRAPRSGRRAAGTSIPQR